MDANTFYLTYWSFSSTALTAIKKSSFDHFRAHMLRLSPEFLRAFRCNSSKFQVLFYKLAFRVCQCYSHVYSDIYSCLLSVVKAAFVFLSGQKTFQCVTGMLWDNFRRKKLPTIKWKISLLSRQLPKIKSSDIVSNILSPLIHLSVHLFVHNLFNFCQTAVLD